MTRPLPDQNEPLLPYSLEVREREQAQGSFSVTDTKGSVWAHSVPTASAAKLIAALPQLLTGFDQMYRSLVNGPHLASRWDISCWGPDLEELADDDGELEEKYPGAPNFALWLLRQRDLLRRLGVDDGVWPLQAEPDQLELAL